MNIVTIIGFVVALFQSVKELVALVEHPGDGADKKATVLDALAKLVAAAPISDALKGMFGNEGFLGALIDIVVAVKNIVGEFTHKTPAAV